MGVQQWVGTTIFIGRPGHLSLSPISLSHPALLSPPPSFHASQAKVYYRKPEVKKEEKKAVKVEVEISAFCQLVETRKITEVLLEKKQTVKSRVEKRLIRPSFKSISVVCPARKPVYEAPKYEAPKYEAPTYEAPKAPQQKPYEMPAMRGNGY